MRPLTSASISASVSSERCASKMLACSAPTSRAVTIRTCSISRRTAATDSTMRRHSSAGSADRVLDPDPWVRRSVAEHHRSQCPARRPADRVRRSRTRPGTDGSGDLLARLVESAPGECDEMLDCLLRLPSRPHVSRPRAHAARPSVATRLKLPAGTGPAPVVRLRSWTDASSARTSLTSRAAGRACNPCGLSTEKTPTISCASSCGLVPVCRRPRPSTGEPPCPSSASRASAATSALAGSACGRHRSNDEPFDNRCRRERHAIRVVPRHSADRGPARR